VGSPPQAASEATTASEAMVERTSFMDGGS
jgi:hypothetical protein